VVPTGFCCSRPRITAARAPSNPPTRQAGTRVTWPASRSGGMARGISTAFASGLRARAPPFARA